MHSLPKDVHTYYQIPVSIPKPTGAVHAVWQSTVFLLFSVSFPAPQSSNDAPSDAHPASFSLVKIVFFVSSPQSLQYFRSSGSDFSLLEAKVINSLVFNQQVQNKVIKRSVL